MAAAAPALVARGHSSGRRAARAAGVALCALAVACGARPDGARLPAVPTCSLDERWPVCVKPLIKAKRCAELIAAAQRLGGYDAGYDSLDGNPAMQIDIMDHAEVLREDLFSHIKPWLPELSQFVTAHFEVSYPYWIFFRRYSDVGNHGRKGVRVHSDSSGATVVIPLNDDFEGGQYVVYDKALQTDTEAASAPASAQFRSNDLRAGAALIHDGIIRHGVEEVTKGTRFSLIVFFAVAWTDVTVYNDSEQPVFVFLTGYGKRAPWDAPVPLFGGAPLAPGEARTERLEPDQRLEARDATGQLVANWKTFYSPYSQRCVVSESNADFNTSEDNKPEYREWQKLNPAHTIVEGEEEKEQEEL